MEITMGLNKYAYQMPIKEEYYFKRNVWMDDGHGGYTTGHIIKPVARWMKEMEYEEKEAALNRFRNNYFVHHLSKHRLWTIEQIAEAPKEDHMWMGFFFGGESLSLDEMLDYKLNEFPERRAYRYVEKAFKVNAKEYRTLCIEVDDTASDAIKEALRAFPVDYAEKQDNRTNYLIWVTNCFDITDVEWMFKEVDEVDAEDGSYRVLLNNRWACLSMNMLPDDQWVKLDRKNTQHVKRIEHFLHVIAETGVITKTPKGKVYTQWTYTLRE
jgi:hypothetical protein